LYIVSGQDKLYRKRKKSLPLSQIQKMNPEEKISSYLTPSISFLFYRVVNSATKTSDGRLKLVTINKSCLIEPGSFLKIVKLADLVSQMRRLPTRTSNQNATSLSTIVVRGGATTKGTAPTIISSDSTITFCDGIIGRSSVNKFYA